MRICIDVVSNHFWNRTIKFRVIFFLNERLCHPLILKNSRKNEFLIIIKINNYRQITDVSDFLNSPNNLCVYVYMPCCFFSLKFLFLFFKTFWLNFQFFSMHRDKSGRLVKYIGVSVRRRQVLISF